MTQSLTVGIGEVTRMAFQWADGRAVVEKLTLYPGTNPKES